MIDLDLTALRAKAEAASKGLPMIRSTPKDVFRAACTPAVILALIERVEKAEALSDLLEGSQEENSRLRALLARAEEALNKADTWTDEEHDVADWRDAARTISREIEEAIGHE